MHQFGPNFGKQRRQIACNQKRNVEIGFAFASRFDFRKDPFSQRPEGGFARKKRVIVGEIMGNRMVSNVVVVN